MPNLKNSLMGSTLATERVSTSATLIHGVDQINHSYKPHLCTSCLGCGTVDLEILFDYFRLYTKLFLLFEAQAVDSGPSRTGHKSDGSGGRGVPPI